ncbi:MAG: arginine--tRNA ligase [Erysipelotrichaceae bacterium]|mgnify:FL=1|jgi:arginyl-tRNA synthetase|nr:arginine--tRNA ligase [Erysipelotrichaceae bacterium]
MNIEKYLKTVLLNALNELDIKISFDDIVIERSRDEKHGDYATNIAMQLAKPLKKAPRDIAKIITSNIDSRNIEKCEIAGPGFINFFIKPLYLTNVIEEIISNGDKYGQLQLDKRSKVNVEFVSANPTGELHLGHARGAAYGDALCRILEKAGHQVVREYYVNDAGVQIDNLAKSLYARYATLLGKETAVPEDGYHSEQLIDLAKILVNEIGDRYLTLNDEAFTYFKKRGVELQLERIKEDLKHFRVKFDVFSYETKIRNTNAIPKVLEKLKPYTYEEEGATLLKTSDYSDDKDRVLIKSNGDFTYFLPDIAYHEQKLTNQYNLLINILGADHHGYIGRMKSALEILGYPKDILEVEIIQMVRIIQDGKEVKMSKRTGNAITLRELCDDVGVDAVRYFFVSRANSSHLDFDLNLAKETSNANPVYYAQYAHARLCGVLERGKNIKGAINLALLDSKYEIDLMKYLIDFPYTIRDSADTRSPYKLTIYAQKLANLIHSFYTECRIIDSSNLELTATRLHLVKAAAITMKECLKLIGVSAPKTM